MQHERARLPPPRQAPFYDRYTEAETSAFAEVGAVSTYWPGFLPWARQANEEEPFDQ